MSYSPLELAGAYLQAGEPEQALNVLSRRLEQHPADDDARRWRAAVLMHLGGETNHQAALADLDRVASPNADDLWRRSLILQALGQPAEALDVLLAARERWPDDEQLIERHIDLLMQARDDEAARALLETLPRSWRWLSWAGDVAVERGLDDEALDAYSDALADLERRLDTAEPFAANMKAHLLLRRAQVCASSGAFAQAAADYADAQRIVPGDLMIVFNRGLLASLQGDLIQALSLCGEALSAAGETLQAQMEYILRGDPRYAPLAMLLLQGDADI